MLVLPRRPAWRWLFALALGTFLLPSRAAWARDCGRTSHGYYSTTGSGELTEKPVDARPWVELREEEADRLVEEAPNCMISSIDGQSEIPVSIEVAPANHEVLRSGCASVGVFGSMFGRVIPTAELEPNTMYQILCDGDFEFDFELDDFQTGDRMASPPPALVVEAVGLEDFCGRQQVMAFDIRGLDASFWEEGGVITAEYEDGSVDWVGSASSLSDPPRVVLARPAEGEEVVVLTVVNGAGVAGPPLELGVTEIAGPRVSSGCSTDRRSARSSHLPWLGLLLLRGRSRRVIGARPRG